MHYLIDELCVIGNCAVAIKGRSVTRLSLSGGSRNEEKWAI